MSSTSSLYLFFSFAESIFQNKTLFPDSSLEGAYAPHQKILKGWDAVDKRVRESDENRVEDFKEDVDTLLVFVSVAFAIRHSLVSSRFVGRAVLSGHHCTPDRII